MQSPSVIDISQEVLTCHVFPGDPAPHAWRVHSMDETHQSNLSAFSMCAHNGTHVDAPLHFIQNGRSIDQMPLDAFVGPCLVCSHEGLVTEAAAERMLAAQPERLLIKGDATMTLPAAKRFADAGLKLVGNESQTFGTAETSGDIHRALLGAGIILLEGITLSGVEDGVYLLCAAPLNLGGCEGAPCRAILLKY